MLSNKTKQNNELKLWGKTTRNLLKLIILPLKTFPSEMTLMLKFKINSTKFEVLAES